MSYTVLARRYRSTTFNDIVGQETIAKTLQNAIHSDRTAHAYLFCGTRGVGKTSMARIFARELNRSDELKQNESIKEAILRGEDLDVIEIDGASNRGVQEARDLIAASNLAPTRCKYRIYIIDEVHMLTTPAFNALLKTMEEPPSHVKFILCTTEPHKVPATIQSRCQRFDFKTIAAQKISGHLQYILENEGISADKEVTAEVARLGNGSMRDALSILDRLLAGGDMTIKLDEMEDALGLPSQTAIMQLCEAISQNDMQLAFESSDALLSSGVSTDRVLEVVANTFRNALIARVCGSDSSILEVSDDVRTHLTKLAEAYDEATLTHLIALSDASSRQVRRGGSGRALFDATVARLCLADQLAEAGSVLTSSKPKSSYSKKKSITPNKRSKPIVETAGATSITNQSPPQKLSWEVLKAKIAETPGLKRVANHLVLSSLEDSKLSITVAKSGRDFLQYILAQRVKIEQLLTKEFGIKFQVIIEANSDTEPLASSAALDDVENDELVQTARGLFNGTVVQVKNVDKGDS